MDPCAPTENDDRSEGQHGGQHGGQHDGGQSGDLYAPETENPKNPAPGGGLVTTEELAALKGCTATTVRNARDAGKIVPAATTPARGGRQEWWDPAAIDWTPRGYGSGHGGTRRRGGGRGGPRRRAGRKRRPGWQGGPGGDEGLVPAMDAAETRRALDARGAASVAAAAEGGQAPPCVDGAIDLAGRVLVNLTHAELAALVALDEDVSRLDLHKLDKLKRLEEVRKQRVEREKAEGGLVPVRDVRSAIAAAAGACRRELTAVPGRVAAELAAMAWVDAGVIDEVCAALAECGADGALVSQVRAKLAPPVSLEHAVRARVEKETDRAIAELHGIRV